MGHLERFASHYAPGLELPSVLAGWPVGPDVRADLAFTLGWLHAAGVGTVAGRPLPEAIAQVLRPLDGARTHTFFSYRVAETVGRFGPLGHNPLVAGWTDAELANLVEAVDSTSWVGLLDEGLPANYAAVLARCELARAGLGLEVDQTLVESLLERTRRLLEANPSGFLDDSGAAAEGRYDIYTVDVHLFCEPFADRLGPVWERGARAAVELVSLVGTTNGAAVPWGRSLGPLAVCHTVELGALACARGLTDEPGRWLALAANAAARFGHWMDAGLSTAHRWAAQDHYRGPERWLQLSFDCLGKLAWSAVRLADAPTGLDATPRRAAFPPRDELRRFEQHRVAGVWSYRSAATAVVVPFVGTPWADYLPAPRNPGLFEVPVDTDLPTAVPVARVGDLRYVGGGLPVTLSHSPGRIEATWDALPELAGPHNRGRRLTGRRTATMRVERRTLHVDERLALDEPVDALWVQLAEADGRPLLVDWRGGGRAATVDTAGLAAYRSFWGELPRVHQLDLGPVPAGAEVSFGWSVTPVLRVATPDPGHHYHRSLWGALGARVCSVGFGGHLIGRPEQARARLAAVDLFHLHWPEWFVSTPEEAAAFVELVRSTDTPLVWTQHNLVPHRPVPHADELYGVFASAADVVVHHSHWGRARVCERYRFRSDAVHVVLPHGPFGDPEARAGIDRAAAEAELGLAPCSIRIGIIGAPRAAKRTAAFMEAFAATRRDDLQLLVCSLGPDEAVPDDPRIVALPYEFVPREVYDRRLATVDVVALPFDPDGDMLTTGTVGDVIGLGLPALASRWPYLLEALGEAALVYDDEDLVEVLEGLDPERLARAGEAARALRATTDWAVLAERLLAVVEDAGALRS